MAQTNRADPDQTASKEASAVFTEYGEKKQIAPDIALFHLKSIDIQSNFDGSNPFGTMQICSRQR